ncbi:MAG: hypothetical protein K5756_08605 [Clostridiales bacterium]|nr:hypothetical protein [Clostridiales bacterium]
MKLTEMRSLLRGMNKYSKFTAMFGGTFTAAIYIASIILFILAGTYMEYYHAAQLSQQLAECVKPCLGITAIGVLVADALPAD